MTVETHAETESPQEEKAKNSVPQIARTIMGGKS